MNKKIIDCLEKCGIENEEEFNFLYNYIMENKIQPIDNLNICEIRKTIEQELKKEKETLELTKLKEFVKKV